MKTATHAAILKVTVEDKPTYYVLATDESKVHGFENEHQGLRYFEKAYEDACGRGGGWVAGAMLAMMYLQPRVFRFGTRDDLVKLLGEIASPVHLNGTGVNEICFEVIDQKAAARIYNKASVPNPSL
jgi:hypothetical protein